MHPEERFTQLVHMVEGERRSWGLRYRYKHQLAAIEALGETGMPQALEYLRKIATPDVTQCSFFESPVYQDVGPTHAVEVAGEAFTFPHAKGKLRQQLA